MTQFADMGEVLNRLTGGNNGNPQNLWQRKDARVAGTQATATGTGVPLSMWEYEGNPAHGIPPTGATVCTNATPGACFAQTDPSGGRQLWCVGATVSGAVIGLVTLYDRLAHIGGLSGTSITSQGAALTPTRYTDGRGNRIFVEVYTTIGAIASSFTVSYVNQDGVAAVSPAVGIGGTDRREPQRIIEVPLAAGDTGVRSVTSLLLGGSTGTAGNFGVVLGHPLDKYTLDAAYLGDKRAYADGFLEILPGACLALLQRTVNVTLAAVDARLYLVER